MKTTHFSKHIASRRIAAVAAAALAANSLVTSAHAAPVQAKNTDKYLDSIGVNFGLEWRPDLKELQQYLELLRGAGIRHIRTGMFKKRFPPDVVSREIFVRNFREARKYGLDMSVILDPRDGTVPTDVVALLRDELGTEGFIAEGPNEPNYNEKDFWVFRYPAKDMLAIPQVGPTGDEALRAYTRDLWTAFKADPSTRKVPIVSASIYFSTRIGNLEKYFDIANTHPYTNEHPGVQLNDYLAATTDMAPNRPVWLTEFGWHSALVRSPKEFHWQVGRPEDVQAKYILRAYMLFFKRGIERSYAYEFIGKPDDPKAQLAEQNFGMLRLDKSPKPTYTALQNTYRILRGGNPKFKAGKLDFSISGDTKDIEQMLLQKSDGKFYLILFNNSSSFDIGKKERINVPLRTLTLNFKTPIASARTFQPMQSATGKKANIVSQKLKVWVPDHPLIVEISPRKTH